MKKYLSLTCAIAIAYADLATVQYCDPFDLSKSKATPVALSDDNQSQISEALINGYILGLESNSLTQSLSDNPAYIFPLTHELLGNYAYSYFRNNKSQLEQDSIVSVVASKSLPGQPLVVDQSYVINNIMANTLTPMTLPPSSINGATSFPGTQSASINSSNNYYALNNVYNDNDSLPNYKYIKDNYLCSKDPTSAIYSSGGSKDISQLIIDSSVLMEQLDSCSVMVANSVNASSDSTSGSNNTATSSTSSNNKQGGTINTTTTKSCDFSVAACHMLYYQNNVAKNISSYIDDFKDQFPNNNNLYNNTLIALKKIQDYDLSKYIVPGLTYPSNCTLTPSCGSSKCYKSTDVTADAPQVVMYIKQLNDLLKKMYTVKINSMIKACSDSKGTSAQSGAKLLTNNFSMADILGTDSFGVTSDNPFACSDKSGTFTQEQTQRAINFINNINNLASPPSVTVPNIPFDGDTINAGSLTSMYNSSNYDNPAKAVVEIKKNRTILLPKIISLREKYQKDLNNYLAAQNLATGNLYKILARRVDALDVPLFKSNFNFDHNCSTGMNNTTNDPKCQFSTPYQNLSSLSNVLKGQKCTAMETMHKEAAWRNQFVKDGSSANLNPWQQMISSGSAADLDRAELFLLAEIKKQQWLNQQIEEEVNATLAVVNILNSYSRIASLQGMSERINTSVETWLQGGKSSSSPVPQ